MQGVVDYPSYSSGAVGCSAFASGLFTLMTLLRSLGLRTVASERPTDTCSVEEVELLGRFLMHLGTLVVTMPGLLFPHAYSFLPEEMERSPLSLIEPNLSFGVEYYRCRS